MIKLQWALSAVLHSEKWMFEPSLTQCNSNVWMCQSAVWSQPRFWLIRLEFSTRFLIKTTNSTIPRLNSNMGYRNFYCISCDICRNVPYRVRVRLARKRNEDEDSPHKLYTLVTYVPVTTFKGKISTSQGSHQLGNSGKILKTFSSQGNQGKTAKIRGKNFKSGNFLPVKPQELSANCNICID